MASEVAVITEQIKQALTFDGQRTLDDVGADLRAIAQAHPKSQALCESAWKRANLIEQQRVNAVAVAGGYKAEADKAAEQLEELATAVIHADRHNSLVDDLLEDAALEYAEDNDAMDKEFAYAEARDTVRGELVEFAEKRLRLNGYHARDFVANLMGTQMGQQLSDAALVEIGELIESLLEREQL